MRSSISRFFAITVVAIVIALSTGVAPAQADASDPRTGVDISWPQCGKTLPSEVAYAIVGVTGGTAATTNNCLAEQLSWAFEATAASNSSQPRIQLYVNTANPGAVLEEYEVSTWPIDNVDSRGRDSLVTADNRRRNPYGRCTITAGSYRGFTNDLACSWQYGWNRAVEAVDQRFGPAALSAGLSDTAADYAWWLDVETMNSWQHGAADALARNTASIEGMKQALTAEGARSVGLYSTAYQWRRIVGDTLRMPTDANPAVGGNLIGAGSWLAGAYNATHAQQRCSTSSGLTGGPVVLNQYIDDDLDYNFSCA
jgi:hypothetical protein